VTNDTLGRSLHPFEQGIHRPREDALLRMPLGSLPARSASSSPPCLRPSR
jgi:hypothetical protein